MSIYNDLIRKGTGIVTGFDSHTISALITKICDYHGMLEETKPIIVLDYVDAKDNPQQLLYVTKDGCFQLAKTYGISITKVHYRYDEITQSHISTAYGFVKDKSGKRFSSDIGVDLGVDTQSAILRSATKAKRRVILSLSGLGFLDEEAAMEYVDGIKKEEPIV